MERNLYQQLSPTEREAIALLLGFNLVDGDDAAFGFRLNLQEVPALPLPFTLGDALRAYCAARVGV